MENYDLDLKISNLINSNDKEGINQLINDYMPFIIKTVSDSKNSYVQLENDEELSIALIAFNEALQKYDIKKGHFISFAKLVILSRLKTHYLSENKNNHISFEELEENALPINTDESDYEDLSREILEFETELKKFGIDFIFLTENSPKHKDTRDKAIDTARKISNESDLMEFTFEKRRLPIQKIAERFLISIKFLKGSKYLIIATLIIINKKLKLISEWVKK